MSNTNQYTYQYSSSPKILISQEVMVLIRKEALSAYECETGGILVGKRLNSYDVLIVAATGPGEDADRRVHTFAPDVRYANQKLQELRKKYPSTDWIGTWHKHPSDLDHPSGLDWKQAKEVLNDPDYLSDELIAPIIVVRDGEPQTRVYYTSKSEMHRDNFISVEHQVIPAPRAEALLEKARQDDIHRYNERLNDEYQRLRGDYASDKPTRLDDGNVIFVVHLAGVTPTSVYLICSAAYPQSPPRVLVEQKGEQREIELVAIEEEWTSEKYLVDVVKDVEMRLGGIEVTREMLPITDASNMAPLRRSIPQEIPEQPSQRPTIYIAGGVGAVLVMLLCVAAIFIGPILFKAENSAPAIAQVSPSPDQTPLETLEVTLGSPSPASIGGDSMIVTPAATFPPDGSDGIIVLQVTGGEPPYTYLVDGQKQEGERFSILWECGTTVEFSYEVRSNDGQKVGPNPAKFSALVCTPTPTSTPTPTPTSTPTPAPTITPTTPSPSPTPMPPEKFGFPELLRAYQLPGKGGQALGSSVIFVGKTHGDENACVAMRFSLRNRGEQSVQIARAGVSLFLNETNLEDMFHQGAFELEGDLLAAGESMQVEIVAKTAGTICGFDLFPPGSHDVWGTEIQRYGIQLTSTLTFKPAIQYRWPGVDCSAAPRQCEWHVFEDGGSVTVQYQQ